MGVKLILLLAMLAGVLYSLHLLVKDYQALTAGSRLLRLLFKRDLSPQNHTKPSVAWRRILRYDAIHCARYLYCDLGARPLNNDVRQGFVYMLMLEPRDEDKHAYTAFREAYDYGQKSLSSSVPSSLSLLSSFNLSLPTVHYKPMSYFNRSSLALDQCRIKYQMCPFNASMLFEIIMYLLRNPFPLP